MSRLPPWLGVVLAMGCGAPAPATPDEETGTAGSEEAADRAFEQTPEDQVQVLDQDGSQGDGVPERFPVGTTEEQPPDDAVGARASLALLRQLERVETGLPRALSGGRCREAGGLRAHICALASRICELAGDEPQDPSLDQRCEDARQRCQSATRRVEDRCVSQR